MYVCVSVGVYTKGQRVSRIVLGSMFSSRNIYELSNLKRDLFTLPSLELRSSY